MSWTPRNGVGEGGLQVAVDATGGAVLSIAASDPGFVWRPAGGTLFPRASFGLGRGVSRINLVGRPEAQVRALLGHVRRAGRKKIAVRTPTAGSDRFVPCPSPDRTSPPSVTDARGNVHLAFIDDYVGRMRAATLSRLDLRPSEFTGPLGPTMRAGPPPARTLLSVNARGQAALLRSGKPDDDPHTPCCWPNDHRIPPRRILAFDSPPHAAACSGLGRVAARRAAREPRSSSPGCERARRSGRSHPLRLATAWITAQPGARPLLTARLKPAERRRLRALVKKRLRLVTTVTVTAEDSSGNRRAVRRRIPVKRLLR